MARIPDAEIQRLKREVSLERLVEARGVELRRHGEDLIGRCPFHDDREPSLVITPAKNLWHCLGACQTGGSVIDWVMKAEGCRFRHAVELLRGPICRFAGRSRLASGAGAASTVPRLPPPVTLDAEDRGAARPGRRLLPRDPAAEPGGARATSRSRGLRSPEVIDRFQLGYANRTLGYRLPDKHADGRGGAARAAAEARRPARQRPRALQRLLVVPVFDEAGRVVEIYGRKIRRRPASRRSRCTSTCPARTAASGTRRRWPSRRRSILCEALLDALTFWCAGFRNVTAAYGVEGFTADHLAAFRRYGIERVLIAYDRDEAGDRGGGEACREARGRGDRLLPGALPARDGRQRVRLEGRGRRRRAWGWCSGTRRGWAGARAADAARYSGGGGGHVDAIDRRQRHSRQHRPQRRRRRPSRRRRRARLQLFLL